MKKFFKALGSVALFLLALYALGWFVGIVGYKAFMLWF